jgi:hypothetical protein
MCGIISLSGFLLGRGEKMNSKKILVIALTFCIVLPSVSIYALSKQGQTPDNPYNEIRQIALDHLINGPTFSFDGIMDSIKIIDIYTMESFPEQHVVIISFDTSHAGWGDREGTFIAQVVTSHVIKITIVEGKVVSAVIDDKWDELEQDVIVPDDLLLPMEACEAAVRYILENHPELGEVEIPSLWVTEMATPNGLVGAATLRYLSEGWNVTVKFPIVQYPDYSVEVRYTGEVDLFWSGMVHNNGEISTD